MIDATPDALDTTHSGGRLTLFRATRMSLLVAIAVAMLDQLTKAWALRGLADGQIGRAHV